MRSLNVCIVLFFCSIVFIKCTKDPVPEPTKPTVNYEDSLKNSLWAYFDFNNGNFNDLSGNRHNMVGMGGLQFNYDMWGNSNNALDFDGVNDFAVIDSGKVFPEGDFTISFLMMPRANTGRVFQKADYNTAKGASFGFGFDQDQGTQNLVFYVGNNDNICDTYTEAQNATILSIKKDIYPSAWYMIVIQHTNGMEKVYINGNLVGSQATPNKTFKNCSTAPFYLGMWWLQDRRQFSG
jgi:hypothetical protein